MSKFDDRLNVLSNSYLVLLNNYIQTLMETQYTEYELLWDEISESGEEL